jgi:putative transposase
MRFAFIDAWKAVFPIALMCRMLDVSRAGYYEWRDREPSQRVREDVRLTTLLAAAHVTSGRTYGSPRLHRELHEAGHRVSRKRVIRLMQARGLRGCRPRRFKATTDSKHDLPLADDLVKRDFSPAGPDEVWVADITYVRTWQGWLYLAVVVDLFSRRVVGWSAAEHMRADLVIDALAHAAGHRGHVGVIHHSDRGSQYASAAFRAALEGFGMKASMSRKGNCWDNAVAESGHDPIYQTVSLGGQRL